LQPLAHVLAKLLRLQQEKAKKIVATTIMQQQSSSSSSSSSSSLLEEPSPPPSSPPCMAIICYEERFDPCAFFAEAKLLDLRVEPVSMNLLHEKYRDPDRIHVLRITLLQQEEEDE
jgi:hypothetical protein